MKPLLYLKPFVAFLLIVMIACPVFGQIQQSGTPFATLHGLNIHQLEQGKISLSLSESQLSRRDYYLSRDTEPGEAMHAGFGIQTTISPQSDGSWTYMGDTLRVWKILVESPGAKATGLILDNFHLNENGRLFIYDPALQFVAGSFTHHNNNRHNKLSIQVLPGETLVVEYTERKRPGEEFTGNHDLFNITELIHVTQGGVNLFNDRNLGNADWCHIDVNCFEGTMWQRQKRGVARMLMRVGNNYFWCSGSLVNNTRQDGTPYFLSAAHCGDDATYEDFLLWQFYFNFERPECGGSGMPAHNVIVGAELMSKGPLAGGSDFQLLKLKHTPPASWRPYYNGWSRLNEPAHEGVGIHHPGGDAKKISTYNQTVTSASPNVSGNQMATNSTWQVFWTETANGFAVTQGGSSGSPLFNENGLIVGTLTGGSTTCQTPTNPDFYGKLSYHWDQNGEFFYEQLQNFLDPDNVGSTTLNGYDPYVPRNPPPGFAQAKRLDNNDVLITWMKPLHTPNKPGWHGYSNTYVGHSNASPERATLFHADAFPFSYPVSVTKLSHIFIENPPNSWHDNRFRFKVYDHTGTLMVYQSPVLEAESLVEVIHELEEPLVLNDKFYVAVAPQHVSGHPRSAFQVMNHGNGVSFSGGSHNWQVVGDSFNQHVFLTKIYVDQTNDQNKTTDQNNFESVSVNDQMIYNDPKRTTDNQNPASGNQSLTGDSNRWENSVTSYRVYKNNEHIYNLFDPLNNELEYVDNSGNFGDIYDNYHITAIYPDGAESRPSNTAWLFHIDLCDIIEDVFPHTITFSANELPDCWTNESTGEGWQTASQMDVMGATIEAVAGDHFAYMYQHESTDYQNHWLITQVFDISELELPALEFWFNTNFNPGNTGGLLRVYVGTGSGSFDLLWDARQHPHYQPSNELDWIRTVEDLSMYKNQNVRFAFQVDGTAEAFVALDNIKIHDAAGETHPLILTVTPFGKGEVYGAGDYISGQTVSVYAEPNVGYNFHYWMHKEDTLITWKRYIFVMPGEQYELTALFSTDPAPVSVTEIDDVKPGITVYPNPTRGNVTLYFPERKTHATIQVIDSRGQVLFSQKESVIADNSTVELNLAHLPAGMYYISVEDQTRREVKPVSLVK